jgi:hypothetical protein
VQAKGKALGQEITTTRFTDDDFAEFQRRLEQETQQLEHWLQDDAFSSRDPVAGFEIEAWLLDDDFHPMPVNPAFLQAFDNELASPELAKFNIELNTHPHALSGRMLGHVHDELRSTTRVAREVAGSIGSQMLLTGILPTLKSSDLTLANMSDMRRYRALNDQVLASRGGRPLKLEITGHEPLSEQHDNVMLEAATTSFQIHIQVPVASAHHYYNASMIASGPVVAASANSPYLFDHELWEETRIPLFEQSVEVGGYEGVSQGPLHRVSFGSGYARKSILECFRENLEHFPTLLPIQFDESEPPVPHLRLHNGTIWRWNRPLIGFDDDGTPHVRIEHRVVPSGPSITDSMANAALYYGLTEALVEGNYMERIPFAEARDNFYKSAKLGLKASVTWPETGHISMQKLLLEKILPLADHGLERLDIDRDERRDYLDVIRARVESSQNGSEWQRRFCTVHGRHMDELTASMLKNQVDDKPVHEWDL